MKKHIKDAAIIALWFIIFKLVIKLITFNFTSLFEDGIWLGLGVIVVSYIILFCVALLILIVSRKRKSQDKIQLND